MTDAAAVVNGVNHRWRASGTQACRDANLTLRKGAIHALVGENGAGKTTFGHILCGVLRPDSGRLLLGEQSLDLSRRRLGLWCGVGLVRQQSLWPPNLHVWEAAVLGRSSRRRARHIAAFTETAEKWGMADIKPLSLVSRMDGASLQRAQFIAAMMESAEVLVLDEPAVAWEEGRNFFKLLERLRRSGVSVLLITHRVEDVFRIADEVTVMRHGSVAGHWDVSAIQPHSLVQAMFGEAADALKEEHRRRNAPTGQTVLAVENLGVEKAGRTELKGANFTVAAGEILGFTGLREEGLAVLEDLLTGHRPWSTGAVTVNGRIIKGDTAVFRAAGFRYVPSDRVGRGAGDTLTVAENLMALESRRVRGLFHSVRMRLWIDSHRRNGQIGGDADQKLNELSGGNIQKIILQRELDGQPRILIAADPTWGLDERSRRHIHSRLREISDGGAAILLLTSDMDEALSIADRTAVVSKGRLSGIRPSGEWTRREAMHCITGGGEA